MTAVKRKLRILYISQYFPPEIGATQTRAFEMASRLTNMGHDVTVLTEFPNHPTGIIPERYKGRLLEKEKSSGFEIVRTWVFARPVKNFITRMLFYISFCLMAIIAGIGLRKKCDIVLATSPPLFVGISGFVLSLITRAKYIIEIRDLWPESAVVLNELSNPVFIRLSESLERFLYRRAKLVVGVTRGIMQGLKRRSVPESKTLFIPNGANIELYKPGPGLKRIRDELGLRLNDFAVGYTGLHGLMHGMDFLLDTAESLQHETGIQFVFIGDGPRKKDLVDDARARRLENVHFLDALPETSLPDYINSFDAGLVTVRNLSFCRGTIPVKMFSYWACEKPILLCMEGEARAILGQAAGGIAVEPENPESLKKAILHLKQHPGQCRRFGKSGRSFVTRHYSRQKQAEQLEESLLRIQKADY